MLGDFFKIYNQDELNWREINNLIIEARRQSLAETNKPFQRRLKRIRAEEESARIKREQDRIDAIQDKEKRIAETNKLAEEVERRQEHNERLDDVVQKTMEQFNRHKQTRAETLKQTGEKRQDERETRLREAAERGERNRSEHDAIAERSEKRAEAANAREKKFLENYKKEVAQHKEELQERDARFAAEEKKRVDDAHKREQMDARMLQSPAEFNQKIKEENERIRKAGQASAEYRKKLAGLPEEKNKAFKARERKIEEDAARRRKPIEQLFDEAYEQVFKHLNDRVLFAYKKGDIHRAELEFIINKAQRIAAEFLHTMLVRRWLNIFSVNRTFRSEQRWFKYIALRIYKELRARRTKESIDHAQGKIASIKERLEQARLEEAYREGLRIARKERDDAYHVPPVTAADILSESDESTTIFERQIENIIKQQLPVPPHEKPAQPSRAKNDLITYLDELETRHPSEEALRETDRSKPSAPWRNPHKEFKDIITYADNIEAQEKEKADLVEFNAQLRKDSEKERKEIDEELSRIDRYNRDKEIRNNLVEEQKKIRLRIYYTHLVEINNRLAQKKAVELGQFINLFF